ncbi:hypothetical protein JCM10213_004837 [Rhodosporidiobolus nylandii]
MVTTPHWVFAVNATLSTLSVGGGIGIAIGWALSPQRQALRQKLVLGLGVTDLLQATVTLAGNGLELSGDSYTSNSHGCRASGFLYQTCVVANAAWTLVIALTTYITLVHPFSSAAAFLERPVAFPLVSLAVLLLGIVPSIPAIIVYDMVDAGGVCWLPAGTTAANLYLFIPRAATLVLVILLYFRLFLFFGTRDLRLLGTDAEADDEEAGHRGSKRLSMASLSTKLSSWAPRRSSDGSRASLPAANKGHRGPISAPLSPIPGSPPIAFSQPFDGHDSSRPQHHSVPIAFPSPRASPVGTTASTLDLDASPHPPKRPSSVVFPHSSVPEDGSPQADGSRTPKPLTPRQMNKRLATLMGVYPIAYCVLVALAIARLIQSISRGNAPAHPALRYISAFLIFSQGMVDAILYLVISIAFKRWTRRGG